MTTIGTYVKWNRMNVYLTTTFDLLVMDPVLDVQVRAEILLPKKHRFIKTCSFKYVRANRDFGSFLRKCKEVAVHDLKNELLVSAFGHEVRQADIQKNLAKFRMDWAQAIIEG